MLREWTVRRAHAVRKRPPAEDSHALRLELSGEFSSEPRLSDARVSEYRGQVWSPLGDSAFEDTVQGGHLVDAPEQRHTADRALARACAGADCEPGADGCVLPFRYERLDLSVFDKATCGAVRLFSDENRVRRSTRLHPGSRVDHIAGNHPFAEIHLAD